MQLAHAGRKASTSSPWKGGRALTPAEGGWPPVGPTADPFSDTYPVPRALAVSEVPAIAAAFADAARRARTAGFDVVEIHAAHGYLIHEFLSPLSNTRTDQYGGSFDNRTRLCLEVVDAVRRVWPERLPVFLRISATDWTTGGWDIEQSVELARRASRSRRRSGRLLVRRQRRVGADSRRARLPGGVRRADPARGGRPDRRRRA